MPKVKATLSEVVRAVHLLAEVIVKGDKKGKVVEKV